MPASALISSFPLNVCLGMIMLLANAFAQNGVGLAKSISYRERIYLFDCHILEGAERPCRCCGIGGLSHFRRRDRQLSC